MPTSFLFINKGPASSHLSCSKGEQNSAIYRHVQQQNVISLAPVKKRLVTRSRYQGTAIGLRPERRNKYNKSSNLAHNKLPEDVSCQMLAISPSICSRSTVIDPFDVSSLPITPEVHHFLSYFESLFLTHTAVKTLHSKVPQSAGFEVIRACISDQLLMKCVLAAMAARREKFDNHKIAGGSAKYILQAVSALQKRIRDPMAVNSKLLYAVMKLYEAEAYSSRPKGALVHLQGAFSVAQQCNPWEDLEKSYAATMCGSEQAFMISWIWNRPQIFPNFADQGPAVSALFTDLHAEFLLNDRVEDGTGQILIASLILHSGVTEIVTSLCQIITDLIEYSCVVRNMLLYEQSELPMPRSVSQWAHLRRYALVFRLMSVPIIGNDFLHAVRVALIVWLSVIANYTAFDRNLQIVAIHLQEVMMRLIPYDALGSPEAIVWILMLGASTGDVSTTRPWFVRQLALFSKNVDPIGVRGAADWFVCLEGSSRGCLYCEVIQWQSHVDIATKILLERLQQ